MIPRSSTLVEKFGFKDREVFEMKNGERTENNMATWLVIIALLAGITFQIGLVGISLAVVLIYAGMLGEYLQCHANEKPRFKPEKKS
jgi:hypothetical protein